MSLGTFTERFLLVCAGLLWVASAQDSGRVGKLTLCACVLYYLTKQRVPRCELLLGSGQDSKNTLFV